MAGAKKFKVIEGEGRRGYPTNGDSWEEALLWRTSVGKDGSINRTLQPGLSNVYAILRNCPEWAGAVVFNDARGEIELVAPPPFVSAERWRPQKTSDAIEVQTAIWLERTWHLRATPQQVNAAFQAIAASRKINPVVAYLESVRWDGVPRLDTWLTRYCGAEDKAYTRGVGAAWLRQGVARAMEPGCPFYGALILEGLQGRGKSTVFSILGGEYFTDDVADLHNKDAVAQVRRSWIVEFPELSAMRRSDIEATKAFLTRRTDQTRLAYARNPEAMARRCIFGGSTNSDAYLPDTTGNRRFWPVKVGGIDLAALAADRDQLWAEAVASWRAGAPANLPPELWAAAAEEQEERATDDVWEGAVARYIQTKSSTTAEDVLVDAVGLKLEMIGNRERIRVGDVLRGLGWGRRLVRTVEGGKKGRRWVFEPLSPVTDLESPSPTPPPLGDKSQKDGVVTKVTNPIATSATVGVSAGGVTSPSPKPIGDLGDLGDLGDKSQKEEGSGVTNLKASAPGVGDSRAYREARRAGYSHTEAASIAQAEGEGVPDV